VLVDQRVRQLPLRAGELNPVPLDRRRRRAGRAELLPLEHEIGDPGREDVNGMTVPAAPETGRAQGTKCWAAGHTPCIGTQATQVKPSKASLAMPLRGHAGFAGMAVLNTV
jgi:hypothetical protein